MGKQSKKGKWMSLPELTDHLIGDPGVAEKLRLADNYMLQLQRMGRSFVLPAEHSTLRPLIENFSKSFPKFVGYVKTLRDTVQPRSDSYISLHELYRTLEVRLVQQQRRERARKALAWLEEKHPRLTTEQKQRWIRKLEQQWGRRRMAHMDAHRRKTTTHRLTTAERQEILDEFWVEIDKEVAKGELPDL